MDAAARRLVDAALRTQPSPRWYYGAHAADQANDLVHHVYIVHGLEAYRVSGGTVPLSWTTSEAADLTSWWADQRVLEYEKETGRTRPARVWAVGAMMAILGCWGGPAGGDPMLALQAYGEPGRLARLPWEPPLHYGRHAAHVLWGLSMVLWPAPYCSAQHA